MKKVLCLVSILVLLSSSAHVFAATAQPSSWAKESVSYMISNGLVPTHLQNDYTKPITRLEFAQLTMHALEVLAPDKEPIPASPASTFTDTTDISVRKAHLYGIISGTGNKTFSPKALITREQISAMLFNASTCFASYAFAEENHMVFVKENVNFSDKSQFSSWAVPFINMSVNGRLLSGMGNNEFKPKGNATREQAIAMLYNLFSRRDVNAHVVDEIKAEFKGKYFANGYAYNYHFSNKQPLELDAFTMGNWTKSDFEKTFGHEFTRFNDYFHNDLGFRTTFVGDKLSVLTIYFLNDTLPVKWNVRGATTFGTYNELKSEFVISENRTKFYGLPVISGQKSYGKTFINYVYDADRLDAPPIYLELIFK